MILPRLTLRGLAAAVFVVAAIATAGPAAATPAGTGRPVAGAPSAPAPGAPPPIALGGRHACALPGDGTVRCWGINDLGQLGDGTRTDPPDPNGPFPTDLATVVAGPGSTVPLSTVTAIAAGRIHTCALLVDTTVRCWGSNVWISEGTVPQGDVVTGGQLGDGSFTDSPSPVVVVAGPDDRAPLSGVAAISAGSFYTCAVLQDGTARCWGRLPDRPSSTAPIPVTDGSGELSGITAIAAGDTYACAVLRDGSVRCWGAGSHGELGDGQTVAFAARPVVVVAGVGSGEPLSGVVAIAAAHGGPSAEDIVGHTCAIRADATLVCWGGNEGGQLGDGTIDQPLGPVPVVARLSDMAPLADVRAVTSGAIHSCALVGDGTVRCWGPGFGPQDTFAVAPITIMNPAGGSIPLSGVKTVAAGAFRTCAVLDSGSVTCWVDQFETPTVVPGLRIAPAIPTPSPTPPPSPTPAPTPSPLPTPSPTPLPSPSASGPDLTPQPLLGPTSGGTFGTGGHRLDTVLEPVAATRVTVQSVDVEKDGRFRLWVLYSNGGQGSWNLFCPRDPQPIRLTRADGSIVSPIDSYCSRNIGQAWSLPPGGTLRIWGLFPAIADLGTPLSLRWYDWNVANLHLGIDPRTSLPFRNSLPGLTGISLDPIVIAQSLAIAAGIVLLVPFPGMLFNSTLEANYSEITGRARRVRHRIRSVGARLLPPGISRILSTAAGRDRRQNAGVAESEANAGSPEGGRFWRTPIGVGIFVLLSALLYGALDPTFALDASSAVTLAGLLTGLVLTLLAFGIPIALVYRRNAVPFSVRALPGTLLIGLACVLISKVTDFHPGYLYGLVVAFVVAAELTKAFEGRATAIAAAGTLVVATASWIILEVIAPLTAVEDPGPVLVVIQTALVMAVVAGIELAVFGMLPLRFLPGDSVFRWDRRVWALVFGIGVFAFVHVLINPRSGYLADTTRTPMLTIVVLFLSFAIGSILFWLYFRFRRSPAVE